MVCSMVNQVTSLYRVESKFGDDIFARNAYEKSVHRHLKCGTTFAAYFATLHLPASKILVDVIKKLGQRAFVGKVNMDRNSPDYYVEETTKGCDDAEEFIRHVLKLSPSGQTLLDAVDGEQQLHEDTMNALPSTGYFEARYSLLNKADTPVVMPIVTPRFVPTCTGEMMTKLGFLSYKYGVPVQSHLSENLGEISWVKELHPECDTYADVYKKYHLLHSATLMGHCCFSSRNERGVIKQQNAAVVHCASSNFNLNSGKGMNDTDNAMI